MSTASTSAPPPKKTLKLLVVTPEKVVLEEVVDFVALPLLDGELGVLPGHQPIVGRLSHGELRLRAGAVSRAYFVDGGFVQVKPGLVTVLTSRSMAASGIDPELAHRDLELAASRPAATLKDRQDKDRILARARALRRLAAKAAQRKSTPT